MKRLSILFLAILSLSFSCTKQEEEVVTTAPAVESEESPDAHKPFDNEEHPISEPLKLGFDMGYVPFHYFDDSGKAIGFGIEVSEEVARRLGRPGIEVVDVNWSGIFSGLFAGQYEAILFSCNVTQERSEMMDFTEPFMASPQMLVARESDAAGFSSLKDLKGKSIGVSSGSVVDTWATSASEDYEFDVVRYDKLTDGVMALVLKKVDLVGCDIATADEFIKQKEGLARTFTVSINTDYGLGFQGMAFATRQEDTFRYELEGILEGMKTDGTLQKLMKPYFGKPNPSDYANIVFAGYGCPGVQAYEPLAYHDPILP